MGMLFWTIAFLILTVFLAFCFKWQLKGDMILKADEKKAVLTSLSVLFAAVAFIIPIILVNTEIQGLIRDGTLPNSVAWNIFGLTLIAFFMLFGAFISFCILWGLKWVFNVKDDEKQSYNTRRQYRFKRTK